MSENEFLAQITEIFSRNKWNEPLDEKRLEQIAKFSGELSETGRRMFIDLIAKFIVIPGEEYRRRILKILNDIPTSIFQGVKNVFIIPILNSSSKNKIKSSRTVAYFFKEESIIDFFQKKGINIIVEANPDKIPKKIESSSSKLIIFVDDFIGTGDTTIECLKIYNSEKDIAPEKVIIISIAVMKAGIERLSLQGVKVFYNFIQDKGIMEIVEEDIKTLYYSEMELLEKEINARKEYHLGYGMSESLIKLIRVPNNVFPVFCLKGTKYAIFPRL